MISVVVPVYNEEEIIPLLHDAVVRAMSKLRDTWEVVYVNDGSTDSYPAIVAQPATDRHARGGGRSFAQLGAHGRDLGRSADRRAEMRLC